MMRRALETLAGAVVGAALGYVVWIVGLTFFPVYPFPVHEWTRDPSLLAGAFAGALVAFLAYDRNTVEWRRRVAVLSIALAALAVVAGGIASFHTVRSYKQEVWASGFGAPLPSCSCVAEGYKTRLACVKWLTTPDNVLDCWGESNVRAVSLLMTVSGVALAIVAAVLGALLLVVHVIERARVFQLDASAPAASAFQRIIRPRNPTVDFARFQAALALLRRRVCRIQFGGTPIGTGFLIGPDLVMTNHHVMAAVLENKVQAEVVRCVFDAAGDDPAGLRQVGLAAKWDVLHSPPSEVDLQPDPKRRDPGDNELDFSVLRLAEPVGNEKLAGEKRGWLELPATFYVQRRDPLVIAQHPRGRPLEIAIDTQAILLVNKSANRVRYRTNTEPGSSGSPCLDVSLQTLIALHHSGDPGFRPAYNEGIPIHKIRERLEAAGLR